MEKEAMVIKEEFESGRGEEEEVQTENREIE